MRIRCLLCSDNDATIWGSRTSAASSIITKQQFMNKYNKI